MNHFLYKKSDDVYIYIYFDFKNNSLSLKRYGKRGSRGTSSVLRTNVERNFSCSVDKSGNIHVAFSIINGGIHYGYFTDDTFHSFQILSGKSQMNYNKNFMISAIFEPVCIFYTIKHDNKIILSMQNINGGANSSSSPKAIDYLADTPTSLNFCENMGGNMFLTYTKKSDEKYMNVIREIDRAGNTVKLYEYFPDANQPLYVDSFYFENDKNVRLLCRPQSNEHLYLITIDEKISSEQIDIKSIQRNQNTFYGLFPIYNKLYLYTCTDGALYSCTMRGGSRSVILEKRPRQYNGNIYPIYCYVSEISPNIFTVPGNLISGHFFYLFNPFSDLKHAEEFLDISEIINIEKRLSTVEKYLSVIDKRFDQLENIKIPQDVVRPDFDT